MDTIAHAVFTFIVFHRVEWVWAAVIFGILPDVLGNGPIMLESLITKGKLLTRRTSKSKLALFWKPMYPITHSLPIPILIGLGLSVFYGAFYWPILAWFAHVLIDIPLHNDKDGNAIPFLWPLSDYKIQGVAWWKPRVTVALWAVIAALGVFSFF